jgi:MoaA/NifB/PqqE/SkfB family radical SAM enzyme
MQTNHVLSAWGKTLLGKAPNLSIEITRECPLRCPGCYAYEDNHLGGVATLRTLSDFKNDELVRRVLAVVDEIKPLHLSIVGGDPLVRYRELEVLLPQLTGRGIHVQVVTSAFRPLPEAAKHDPMVYMVVSIDGLQPEHDVRRKPATYERILKSIAGHRVTVHCTITAQMMKQPDYLERFLAFWTPKQEIKKVWMSMFTPQIGARDPEILNPEERQRAIQELLLLRKRYPKLDMPESMIREFAHPPKSPDECIFSKTTQTISADLKTKITPCQFGGNPDCTQCGCIASMGLAAVGKYKVGMGITAGKLYHISYALGSRLAKKTAAA